LLEDDARRARLAAAAPARARALCDPGQQLRMLCGALANIEAAVPVRR
jgi:hypothetical protein